GRSDQDRQHPAFDEQRIPLEREELPARVHQRDVEKPERREDGNRRDADHEDQRQSRPGSAQTAEKTIRGAPPAERREDQEHEASTARREAAEIRRREKPAIADQSGHLPAQREKRRQIDQTEEAQEEPARENVVPRQVAEGRHARWSAIGAA